MVANLKLRADQLGLPFGTRTRTYNSRLAQELGLWAEENGRGEAFHRAAFHAYFADGQNLASRPVLLALAEKAGLPASGAETVIDGRTHAARVDRDWDDSRLLGITAVPTFVIGSHKLVGAQDYQTLCKLMQLYGVASRETEGR